jgi:hypothetical protein
VHPDEAVEFDRHVLAFDKAHFPETGTEAVYYVLCPKAFAYAQISDHSIGVLRLGSSNLHFRLWRFWDELRLRFRFFALARQSQTYASPVRLEWLSLIFKLASHLGIGRHRMTEAPESRGDGRAMFFQGLGSSAGFRPKSLAPRRRS